MDFKLTVVLLASALALCHCRMMPGGLFEADANDETVQQIADFAVSEIGTEYSLDGVTRAQTQVTNGYVYHLELLVTRVRLTNGSSKQYSCTVKVFDQSWAGVQDLEEFSCSNA